MNHIYFIVCYLILYSIFLMIIAYYYGEYPYKPLNNIKNNWEKFIIFLSVILITIIAYKYYFLFKSGYYILDLKTCITTFTIICLIVIGIIDYFRRNRIKLIGSILFLIILHLSYVKLSNTEFIINSVPYLQKSLVNKINSLHSRFATTYSSFITKLNSCVFINELSY